MAAPFSSPFLHLVGIDTKAPTAEIATFSERYGRSPLVLGAPGFALGHCYELLTPDPRGDFAPRLLAACELSEEGVAEAHREGQGFPPEAPQPPLWPKEEERSWSVVYRQLSSTSSPAAEPFAIFLVGINARPDLDDAGLEEFNDFYSNVHVPEGIEKTAFTRATRYELYGERAHPEPGCPRFLAVWEADAKSVEVIKNAAAAAERGGGSPFAPGPDAWRDHTTPWRIWYRALRS